MKTSNPQYNLQPLEIPSDWTVRRNEFYDIDPAADVPENDKYFNIYCQEVLLLLEKEKFHLDLGRYGSDNFDNDLTGYCIHLFKGDSWLNSKLLVKFRSKDKNEIVNQINSLIKTVDNNDFEKLQGYRISDENTNDFSDFNELDVRKK